MTTETTPNRSAPEWPWHLAVLAFLVGLWLACRQLVALSGALKSLLPVEQRSHAEEAIAVFLYGLPKVFLLLTLIAFLMGIVRSFFSAERTRALLAGRREGIGNVPATLLRVVTPFCSCSAVPVFIGPLSAAVPLGVTLSFLISAPMVNEVALALLLGLVGWNVAALFLGFGLAVAIIAGWVIGRLHLEGWLQDWVREILGRVWIWILLGIGLGAMIHGHMPQAFLARIMGGDMWWSVPATVALGIPMYTNAAGVIPIAEAPLGKGAALAFMISVIALGLPKLIILRQVLTLRLIGVFVGVLGCGILAVGYLFNLLF